MKREGPADVSALVKSSTSFALFMLLWRPVKMMMMIPRFSGCGLRSKVGHLQGR